MTTYSQRYSSSDTSTAGAFVFHADASGNDVAVSKIVFGAAGVDPTIVTASVGLPITILAGTASIGKLASNSGVTIGAVEIASAQTLATVTTVGTVSTITNVVHVDDNSGSLTIDNAALSVTGGGLESTALRVTLASDSTGVLSVDDNGSTLSIDDGAGSITVDGAVAATQSGTWSVRSQDGSGNALTSAVRGSERALSVQLVDGSGTQITSFGGGTQYAEDAGHSTGDTGTMALAVRNDSDTSLCGTTLDYTPLQVDANGYLKVNIKAGAGSGGTASTDDAAFTASSGSGTPLMGFVTADSVDSGDVGVVAMLANRQLKVTLYDSGGVEAAVGGGTQYTEGATDASITGTALLWEDAADTLVVASSAKPLPIGDAGGTLTVDAPVGTPVFVRLSDGASAISTLPVSLASVPSHAVTNAGTFAVQAAQSGTWTVGISAAQTLATVTTVSTVTTLSTLTGGGVAHDGADSGNPVKVGGKAVTTQSGQTAVASGDRSDVIQDLDGTVISRSFCNGDLVTGTATTTGTSDTSVVAAQGTSTYFYMTGFNIYNSGSTAAVITLKDGNAGSTLWTTIAPAGGGSNFNMGGKPIIKTSANTALYFAASAASTTIGIAVTGFKSKV